MRFAPAKQPIVCTWRACHGGCCGAATVFEYVGYSVSPGLNAIIEGDLPGARDVVVLTNVDPPMAERVAAAIRPTLGAAD